MEIEGYTTEKGKITVPHDLNFQKEVYESVHTVTFKNPSQALQERLRETGTLPTDAGAGGDRFGKKKGGGGLFKKGAKYDYEKMAEAMEQLDEDDLLRVIQIINDGKNTETYIKSDMEGEFFFLGLGTGVSHDGVANCVDLLEAGEFSIDLYTMSDALTKQLWDHLVSFGVRANLGSCADCV